MVVTDTFDGAHPGFLAGSNGCSTGHPWRVCGRPAGAPPNHSRRNLGACCDVADSCRWFSSRRIMGRSIDADSRRYVRSAGRVFRGIGWPRNITTLRRQRFRKGLRTGDTVSIRKAFQRAGLNDCTIHTSRHTHASRLIQNGINIYEVKEILGHADIKTTMRYAHLEQKNVTSRARDVIDRLNQEIAGVVRPADRWVTTTSKSTSP